MTWLFAMPWQIRVRGNALLHGAIYRAHIAVAKKGGLSLRPPCTWCGVPTLGACTAPRTWSEQRPPHCRVVKQPMGNWQAFYLFNAKVQDIRFKEMCTSHEMCGRAICSECKIHGYKFLTCRQCRIWGYSGDPAKPDLTGDAYRDYLENASMVDSTLCAPPSQELFTDALVSEFAKANISIHNMFTFPEYWWRAEHCF